MFLSIESHPARNVERKKAFYFVHQLKEIMQKKNCSPLLSLTNTTSSFLNCIRTFYELSQH